MNKEFSQFIENDKGSSISVFKSLGIDPDDTNVYFPALAYRYGNEQMVANLDFNNGMCTITSSRAGCESIFVPETALFTSASGNINLNISRFSKISKTAAIVDVQKGLKNRVMTLQPEILIWDIASTHLRENKSEPETFTAHFPKIVQDINQFWEENDQLLDLLGIDILTATNITASLMTMERFLNSGDLPKVEQILKIDPHLASIYFGHKTSELLAGYVPPEKMMTVYQMFLSRNLEISPYEIESTDFITKTEWANTLNLFRDSIFSITFPRSFLFSNFMATKKSGEPNPLIRQFKLMNELDLSVFELETLTTLEQYPTLWVEKRPKGLMRSCQKASAEFENELKDVFTKHTEVNLVSMTNSDIALTGLETLLGIKNPSALEVELLAKITTNLYLLGDDLAFKTYLPPQVFDLVVKEMKDKIDNPQGVITKVYGPSVSIQSSITKTIDLGDEPHIEYMTMWKEFNKTNAGSPIYMMAYYKNQIKTLGKGITASIHLAPYDERVILSAWRARLPFTLK